MSGSSRIAVVGLALLACALPLRAQLQFGSDLRMNLNGSLSAGYSGAFGGQSVSGHGLDLGGQAALTGSYYNPNFISFDFHPYFNRSQNNSDVASIFSSSGGNGNVNFFGGSHFPGSVSFSKFVNSTGQYGFPGIASLTTNGSNQGWGINWSALVPDLPTLSVGYARNSGSSSLLGSATESTSSNRLWTLRSTYGIAGFSLAAGLFHQNNDGSFPTFLGAAPQADVVSSSTSYQFSATHSFPLHGHFSSQFTRTNYHSESSVGENAYTTDTANANLNFMVKKLPVSFSANYTDNLFASLLQSEGTPLLFGNNPVARSLVLSASTNYVLWKLNVSGYVNHVEQSAGLVNYSATQFGGTANYNFSHRWLNGLTVSAGLIDTANKDGNVWTGFMGGANYIRRLGGWELAGTFSYDQTTQTVLNVYTTSSMRFGGSVRRRFSNRLVWTAGFTGAHSGFSQQEGNSTASEAFHTTVSWRRFSLSGFYSQSQGTSVLTANGLVALPLPNPIIPSTDLILYNANGFGFSFSAAPVRNLTVTTSYSKAKNASFSPALASNNGTNTFNGRATYRFRKLYFDAGSTRFQQFIRPSFAVPASVTSYYFGISRWFDFF